MPRVLSPLGARIALAFLAVAGIAVGLLSGLTLLSARSQVDSLTSDEQTVQAADIAAALSRAYTAAGGWTHANLSGAYALAASASARLGLVDATGGTVATDELAMQDLMQQMQGGGTDKIVLPPTGSQLRPPITVAVVAGGSNVGTARVAFPAATPAAEQAVRDALLRTVAAGAVLAAVVALLAAVFVSRRLTRPLTAMTEAARILRSGDRTARVSSFGPGELGDLAVTFNTMAETLQREEAVRRALVADVAHELRTPVTILQGQCEELLDGIAAASPERLTSLHDEVLRLSRLVEDLETLNAAQAAGLRLERRPIDLATIADAAAGLLRSRFEDADIQLTTDLRTATVVGDATRLHQVVVNLLTNALKYTPPRGHVSLRSHADDALAVVEVTDDGLGIPAEELTHVFERFWRGSGATATATTGSGVGLAVVAELARAHGGRVEVASTEGEGTCFRVLLPRP